MTAQELDRLSISTIRTLAIDAPIWPTRRPQSALRCSQLMLVIDVARSLLAEG